MALLSRGRPSSSEKRSADGRMSIVEHLEDLRRCLIISAIGWLVATIVAFVFWQRILDLLIARAGLQASGLFYTHPAGAFGVGLTIALVVGLVASAPILFWQAWTFISPGLHEHERRLALPLIFATSFFFLLGIAFALFSLPLFIKVLTGFAPADFHYLPLGDELLGFIMLITIAFGLVFELPCVFVRDIDGVQSNLHSGVDVAARAVADHPTVGFHDFVFADEFAVGLRAFFRNNFYKLKEALQPGALNFRGLLGGLALGE